MSSEATGNNAAIRRQLPKQAVIPNARLQSLFLDSGDVLVNSLLFGRRLPLASGLRSGSSTGFSCLATSVLQQPIRCLHIWRPTHGLVLRLVTCWSFLMLARDDANRMVEPI